jgi:hypothetical protein
VSLEWSGEREMRGLESEGEESGQGWLLPDDSSLVAGSRDIKIWHAALARPRQRRGTPEVDTES